ncbi:MAG: tetratricopeptide repeat protein [bacterium]|nr:tetratricopeptide repeat protein [bacterium]
MEYSDLLIQEAQRHLAQGNGMQAEKLLKSWPEISYRMIYELGGVYLRQGRYEDACECFYYLLKTPFNDSALVGLGKLMIRFREYDKALGLYNDLLPYLKNASRPNWFHCHMNMAEVYDRKGEFDNALNHLRQIGHNSELSDNYKYVALLKVIYIKIQTGEIVEAFNCYQTLLKNFFVNEKLKKQLSFVFYKHGLPLIGDLDMKIYFNQQYEQASKEGVLAHIDKHFGVGRNNFNIDSFTSDEFYDISYSVIGKKEYFNYNALVNKYLARFPYNIGYSYGMPTDTVRVVSVVIPSGEEVLLTAYPSPNSGNLYPLVQVPGKRLTKR